MFTINKNPSTRDLRVFAGGMLAIPLLVLVVVLVWRSRHPGASIPPVWMAVALGLSVIGLVAGILALAAPKAGRTLYIAWMTATVPIGVAMSTLLLTVLYFVLLPVFSLIVRRQDPLRKKLGGATYWEDYRPHEPTIERMRRPF